jgi:hypothetical protein
MAINATGREAGTYAQQRYAQGARRWRSKIRRILAAVLGPFILIGIAALVVYGHPLAWAGGALAGACAAAWAALRETPPAYIENWQRGAEGERKTAGVLKALERLGLAVVHDVESPYGNYDHIAVGTQGVFVLESKYPHGTVELRGGVPHLRRPLDPDADTPLRQIRPRALSVAARLKREIEERTGKRTWVQAVVVFWAEFPEEIVDDGRCVFLHGSRLADWIRARPNGLNQGDADTIARAIRRMADDETMASDVASRA